MIETGRDVEISRIPLEEKDIEHLDATWRRGYLRAVVSTTITFIFFVIADSNEVGLWFKLIIIFFGALAVVLDVAMSLRSKKHILHGEKNVVKGRIWDVIEDFETKITTGKHSKASGIRQYIFKLGEIEHCFYKYSHSYKFTDQDKRYSQSRDAYHTGDLVCMHYTMTDKLLRISLDEKATLKSDRDFSTLL